MIKTYRKGALAERELANFLKKHSFAVIRAAGSGSSVSTPDLIAVKKGVVLAFEIKSWSTKPRLRKEELKMFKEWCELANAIGFFVWRKGKDNWLFLDIKKYKSVDIQKNGMSLNDLISVFDI